MTSPGRCSANPFLWGSNRETASQTSVNVTIVANGQSVTTSTDYSLTVGNDISGPYVSGRWKQGANGAWSFTDASGKNYADEWAYVHNPHSTTPEKAGWFSFDAAGNMRSGWFTDKDGHRYFLNDDPADPNFGLMQTGWVEIGGSWYYFNPVANGTRGSLFVNTTTPDGWRVDANGRRIGRA